MLKTSGNAWAKIGRLALKQYFNQAYAKYTLLAGEDNFGEYIAINILEIGHEKYLDYTLRFGLSYGNESLDSGGGAVFSDEKVKTFFASLKYYFAEHWGLASALAHEYRDNKFFRDTATLGIFERF